MNSWIPYIGVSALLGSALIGGVFFAFSNFVMKSLARITSAEGIAAMQSINIAVINPGFLGVFIGTAVLSAIMLWLSLGSWTNPSSLFFIAGAVCYIIGTFLVTMFGNVPLNDQLAAVSSTAVESEELWSHYLNRWTLWNHVRTVGSVAAALFFTLGLLYT